MVTATRQTTTITYTDIENLYIPIVNSTAPNGISGKLEPAYTITGQLGVNQEWLSIILQAASIASISNIQLNYKEEVSFVTISISWLLNQYNEQEVQKNVNKFIWQLYSTEINEQYRGIEWFRHTLKNVDDYDQQFEGNRYMVAEHLNYCDTAEQRRYRRSTIKSKLTEQLRLVAIKNGWLNQYSEDVDNTCHTRLMLDYLALDIIESDNKIMVRHIDYYRHQTLTTGWLDDVSILSNIIANLYTCFEDGWGTNTKQPPTSAGIAQYLSVE